MKSHSLQGQKVTPQLVLFLEFYNSEEQGPHAAQGTVLKQAVEKVNHRAELEQQPA
jgi:hypothetical protein